MIEKKSLISLLLIFSIVLGIFPIQVPVISATTETLTKSYKIKLGTDGFFDLSSSRSNATTVNAPVPDGYKIKSYELWTMVANSKGELKQTNLRSAQSNFSYSNSEITVKKFSGTKITATSVGYSPDMYFAVNRRSNGKEWVFKGVDGVAYNVTPPAGNACWQGNLSICPGILRTKDDNGKTISSQIKDSQGWAIVTNPQFNGPSYYSFNNEPVTVNKLISSTIEITRAKENSKDMQELIFHKVLEAKKGNDGYGYISIAVPMDKANTNWSYNDCNGCTGNAIGMKYLISASTDWSGQTYYYEGEVRVTYEKLPPVDQPYLDCTCKADPSTVAFADKDVAVNSTITATIKQRGSLKIKNWKVFGRLKDGTQYQTQTIAQVLDTISYKFAFTIPKAQLSGRDSFTETFVMRAIVTFTDGTTAEQAIECTTTVTKPGVSTPIATASNGGSEPTPAPRPILEVNANWSPTSIFTGDRATLSATARGYTDYSWELTENLDKFNFDQKAFSHPAVTFNEPGVYKATLNVSNDYESLSDTALLYVNDPKPVAIISGVTRWIQGRSFPQPHHLNNSFSPLSERGVTIDFSKSEIRFKKNDSGGPYTVGVWPAKAPDQLGAYTLEGKVHDSQGRESEWTSYPLEIVPDQPPVVALLAAEQGVRHNENTIYMDASSPDGDKLERLLLEERYDADNDGDFNEEPWHTLYNGAYKEAHSVKYTTVGKRQYRATVTEDYGLSAQSAIVATDIINRAPSVDFTAIGLTQQPDQGESSGPPITSYSPESILRSWVNKTPYEGGATNKASWKPNGVNLTTRNALWADFNGSYNLAKKMKPLPAWEGSIGQIYAGYKTTVMTEAGYYYAYSYKPPESKNWVFSIRDVWTGQIEHTYVHPGNTFKGAFYQYHPTQMKQAYFLEEGTVNVSGDTLRVYNIETGQLIEEYPNIAPPATGGTAGSSYWDDPSNKVIGTAFSPDRQFLYVAYRENNGGRTFEIRQKLYVAKYSIAQKTLYWTKLVHAGIDAWNIYQIGSVDVDANGNLLVAANMRRGTEDNWTALFYVVNPNGQLIANHVTGKGMLSAITMSADRMKSYATSMRFEFGNYGYSQVSGVLSYGTATNSFTRPEKNSGTIDVLKFPYELAKTAVNKSGVMATPYGFLIMPDGSITRNDDRNPYRMLDHFIVANDKSPSPSDPIMTQILWPKTGLIGPFSQPSDEFWAMASGVKLFNKITYQTAGGQQIWASSAFQKLQHWAGVLGINQTPSLGAETYESKAYFVTETMKYSDGNGYDGVAFNASSNVLPNGSVLGIGTDVIYTGPYSGSLTSKKVVIPFTGESTGDLPRLLNDATVEVDSEAWGGLLYDPNSIMRNQVLEFELSINHLSNDRPIGAAIQIQDEKNMYAVEWTSSSLTLYKVMSGNKTVLAQAAMPRSAGIPYAFRLESLAGVHRVSINGVNKLEATDATYKKGSAGLMSLGQQQASFSQVKRTNYGDSIPEETYEAVLIGEQILYNKLFNDPETDAKLAEKWSYTHNPNYFANTLGLSQYNGKAFDTALNSLEKPGLYAITYSAQDNPGLADYRLFSEPVTKSLYVHRRPIAQPDIWFTGTVYAGGEALDYLTHDTSYDPDVPGYLADRLFRTRWADESTWTTGKRLLYSRPGIELIVQEQVKDMHGAWSFWAETRVYKEELPAINQSKPEMVITYPAGSSSAPTVVLDEPNLKWIYRDKENDPQEQFYLKLTYVDNGETALEVEYPGSDASFQLEAGTIDIGRKVKVQGRVFSRGAWSDDSNVVYFIIDSPPTTYLLSYNGATASEPIYTNNNRPNLRVFTVDPENDPITAIDYEVFFHAVDRRVLDTNMASAAASHIPAFNLQEGLHYWKARAYDSYVWGPYSSNGYFFVDTVQPDDVEEQLEIKPTSVTVNFNAFSDAAPSSGHAARVFYMQKVHTDGSVTTIDLNGDGLAEYSMAMQMEARSHQVTGLIPGQTYRLTVIDTDVAGNPGKYAYIYFVTNRPPTVDADWSPKPIFEGDIVTFEANAADPDKDTLSLKMELQSPSGKKYAYDYTVSYPYAKTGPKLKMEQTGTWQLSVTVDDGLAEPVTISQAVQVQPLKVAGMVNHTDDWNSIRKSYNKKQSGDEEAPRASSVFWAGEKFILVANATETGTDTKPERVEVAMNSFKTKLEVKNTAGTLWAGELWDASFEKLNKGTLSFTFTAYYNNGTVKEDVVQVKIDGTVNDVLGVHRVR
ncbi:hypothetical protein BBD42_04970 [Paenibacillus sp. BIHB 4019]|uniref:PKD/Chitinase domain-containing protein n=2 Tax=Paenibacillus sp. BIHB 4019 TaxID=1870819 RepID=A0A1B2DDU4_9BACL|nr:hypothetical protein BBD42_04970 [Paenibacillus sp. BIHB 4019]